MAMLNRPSMGYEALLILIYQYLYKNKNSSREEMFAIFCPPSLCDKCDSRGKVSEKGSHMVNKTINCWVNLGLFLDENEVLTISEDFRCEDTEKLPVILRKIIFRKDNVSDQLWDYDRNKNPDVSTFGSTDFVAALCFCLTHDIYQLPIRKNAEEFQRFDDSTFSDNKYRIMKNDTRFNPLKDWMSYLGFAVNLDGGLVIDPSEVLNQELPNIFNKDNELDHKTFFSRLAELIPVFDNGKYRLQLEEKLDPKIWKKTKKHEISQSLSRALINLEFMRYIELIDNPDYPEGKISLLGRESKHIGKPFTHIKLKC